MNIEEYRKKDLEDCVNFMFSMAIDKIKNHKIKENLSHEEFKKEIEKFNKIFIENPLKDTIPYIKKENRKQLLEEYKKIAIDFVNFTYKIGEFSLNRKDIENMSIEEKKDIIKDYLS